jgi:hypothetical protein
MAEISRSENQEAGDFVIYYLLLTIDYLNPLNQLSSVRYE